MSLPLESFGLFFKRINGHEIKFTRERGFEQILILNDQNDIIERIIVPNRIKGTVKIHNLKRSFPNNAEDDYAKKYPLEKGDVIYDVYTHPDGGKSLSEFIIAGVF